MTHNKGAVLVSRAGHIVGLSSMLALTWAFIFAVL